jgi:hypothetical protein
MTQAVRDGTLSGTLPLSLQPLVEQRLAGVVRDGTRILAIYRA